MSNDQFKVTGYTNEKPEFKVLADLREQAKGLLTLIDAVAEGSDVAQRMTDLHSGSYDFMEKVTEVAQEEQWHYSTN